MYVYAEAVDETQRFVVNNSGKGSSIIFNYTFQSVVDGTYDLGVVKAKKAAKLARQPACARKTKAEPPRRPAICAR